MQQGGQDLLRIRWGVGRLVLRDGKTPCTTAFLLSREDRIILNLNHPQIQRLVALSKKSPQLAGHFAIALCLSRDQRRTVLNHLPPERREELIYLDAVFRCGRFEPAPGTAVEEPKSLSNNGNMSWKDFLRNASKDGLGQGGK